MRPSTPHAFVLAAAAAVLAFPTTPTTRGADAPESIAPLAPIPKGQRLFFCGHSFHFHVPAMLDELAKAAGFNDQVIVGKSMIGGSKSLSHWNVKDEANEAKKALQAGSMDVLTLTPIYLPDEGIERFAQLGLEHNPNIRVTVQEFWLPFDQYEPHFYDPPQIPSPSKVDHNAATGASLRAMHERYFDEMDAHIRAVNLKLGKQVLFVAPVGGAVIALREKIIAGEAPGLKAQEDLFTDALGHPAAPLQALITYVHYAVIYRKNPVGLPAPAILAQLRLSPREREKLTRLLEELAWDAVTHHPLSGVTASQPPTSAGADTRDDASPWGMAAGADEMGYYAKCTPILHQAGVRWLRLFPEWQTIEPKHGQWNWEVSDKLVANARANNIHLMGLWYYFAPWASADGGTRKGPVKDLKWWSDYVSATVSRYRDDIKYWEVWNEFDGSFYEGRQAADKVKDYADLVVAAYDAARKVAPDIKIGTCVGAGFLDLVIKAGAANHFDFISLHPYSNLGTVAEGGELGYLSLVTNLRQMLAANQQPANIPLWITEFGQTAPIKAEPQRDAWQAERLVKGYVLSLAQGFQRIFWFETRGGSEDGGVTDWGIIRSDWTPRPSYEALTTLIKQLGEEPKYSGWLELGKGGYGFMFSSQGQDVLAAWAPVGKQITVTFPTVVQVTDLAGKASGLSSQKNLVLSSTPVFISQLPAELCQRARENRGKSFPWGAEYANAKMVTCTLGFSNTEDGLKQIHPDTTVPVSSGLGVAEDCRRTDFRRSDKEGHYVYFTVDPWFVPYGTRELQFTILAKRVAATQTAGMSLCYESTKGYTGAQGYWTIPEDDQWHEHTWKVNDANFANEWGWNFRFDAIGSPDEFLVKKVRVTKPTHPSP